MLTFRVDAAEDRGVLLLIGDIDIDVSDLMEEAIPSALASYPRVEIDFGGVPFVDSSGIGLLIALVRALQQEGKQVEIVRVREEVMEVFDLLQLQEILGEEVLV
ncbi:STAS domain-containing protein [Paenibacillus sp.]|uniref:STAS domain-containing protein n=1 Tax=Paenibacillus sp. TaxID=58172 RepID=UPI0028110696|nr:STAS domain-containing protein [Paenibacillus sp.]